MVYILVSNNIIIHFSNFIISFNETKIGIWFNGKPLYRKMVDFGVLPAHSIKNFACDIENLSHVHINLGLSFWYPSSDGLINSGYSSSNTFVNSSYIIFIAFSRINGISIMTNEYDAKNYSALVCLEYTKTTD